ncbi:hypothetical protein [Streptomyces cylindrosporus]|uniref:Uncharacterized protein n=1 Tax=Streptomyces cylindrosporus TaxID=2927583 RepID=A0ABS9XXH1_9ACTN|nr:hypothetical protein [Streptomyces cylindrosporus]MCI3269659.1 hypothetical protein [Streptomyces cylindrosporus]
MTIYSDQPPIIGLASDRPGAGKTTAARYLVEAHHFRECSVGAAVKAEVDAMVRLHGFQYDESQKEDFRDGLIWWTDFRVRHSSPNYWLQVIIESVAAAGADPMVVSDVRFPEEADYIRSVGGIVVKITRQTSPVHGNSAERKMVGYAFDQVVSNDLSDGGERMFRRLDELVSNLRLGHRLEPKATDMPGVPDAN